MAPDLEPAVARRSRRCKARRLFLDHSARTDLSTTTATFSLRPSREKCGRWGEPGRSNPASAELGSKFGIDAEFGYFAEGSA